MMNLGANQQYKISGSSLPFSEWISREKAKGKVIPKIGVTDVFEKELENISKKNEDHIPNVGKKVFGLNKNILILSALVVVSAIAYKVYKNK
mgnify:CR=1 FL=1